MCFSLLLIILWGFSLLLLLLLLLLPLAKLYSELLQAKKEGTFDIRRLPTRGEGEGGGGGSLLSASAVPHRGSVIY